MNLNVALAAAIVLGSADVPNWRPPGIGQSMAAAQVELATLEICQGPTDREFDRLFRRYHDLENEVAATWGAEGPSAEGLPEAASCEQGVATHVARFDAALADATGQVGRSMVAFQSGGWLGPLRLCGIDAAVRNDEQDLGAPALTVKLPPDQRSALARLTEGLIGKRVAFRADGETIYIGVVESISSGELQISGPALDQLERMKAVISAACTPVP